jgi:hypothetical protein
MVKTKHNSRNKHSNRLVPEKKKNKKKMTKKVPGGLIEDVMSYQYNNIPAHAKQVSDAIAKMIHNPSLSNIASGIPNALDGILLQKTSRKHMERIRTLRTHMSKHKSQHSHMESLPAAFGAVIKGDGRDSSSRVRHREILSPINLGTGSYFIDYVMNPGNTKTFPWGARVARNFELFNFHNINFFFIPTGNTTSVARVAMVWDPDWEDPPTTDIALALNNPNSIAGPAFAPMELNIPKKYFSPKMTNAKYVRGDNSNDENQDRHDLGKFRLLVENGGGVVGWLGIEYDVTFTTPQLHELTESYGYSGFTKIDIASGATVNDYLSNMTPQPDNNIDHRVELDGTTITFKPGYGRSRYHIMLAFSASSTTGIAGSFSSMTVNKQWTTNGATNVGFLGSSGGSGSTSLFAFYDLSNSDGGSATFSSLNTTGIGKCNLLIHEVPDLTFADEKYRLESVQNKIKALVKQSESISDRMLNEIKYQRLEDTSDEKSYEDADPLVVMEDEWGNQIKMKQSAMSDWKMVTHTSPRTP